MKAFMPDFTFVYGDAEFIPHNQTFTGLISIALHSEQGSVYLVNRDMDQDEIRNGLDMGSIWRRENVWEKLPRLADGSLDQMHSDVFSYIEIRATIDGYFRKIAGERKARESIGFVADHGTQDMQRIHNLWRNDWSRMPAWIPRYVFQDLATLEDLAGVVDGALPQPDGTLLPVQMPDQMHHALHDAVWDGEVHALLLEKSRAVRIASGVERA